MGRERASELEKIKLEKEAEIQKICTDHAFKVVQMQLTNREQDIEHDDLGA